jgi:glutathione S-transferase
VPKEDEANGQKRALVEQWISADHDNFSPALAVVVIEKFHWHRPEENQELIKVNQDKLEGFFNILDAHFAKNQYFIGDEITFAGSFMRV